MYSGSESTSRATNMTSRSPAAGNSIMPTTANRVSGNTSVVAAPTAQRQRLLRRAGVAAPAG